MRHFVLIFALVLVACGKSSAPPATTTPAPADTGRNATATTARAAAAAAASDSVSTPVWNPASARSWDRNLLALMPEIDACFAQAPYLRIISYAGRDQNGVLVVMQGEETFDCRVTNNQAKIGPHTSRPSGDGDAEFARGPGSNPGGECYTAPEVRDAHGNVLGWMIDPEGC